MRALVVPADPSEPVRAVDLDRDGDRLRALQQSVGGYVEVQSHDTHDFWLNDSGRIEGLPLNDRVTHWVLNDSAHAEAGELRGYEEYWTVYGDVVVTGPPDRNGDITPVPQEILEHFSAMELGREAMRDWDTHEVPPVVITDWPEIDEPDVEPPSVDGMEL